MLEIEALDNVFQLFQQTGLNSGGIWKAVEISKNGKELLASLKEEIGKIEVYSCREKYKNYFVTSNHNNVGLELIEIKNWQFYFDERIVYWSNFEGIWKEENKKEFNQTEYDEYEAKFKQILYEYLNRNQLRGVFKIN